MIDGKKIAFVLGGGGSLGFAHIGFLKYMEGLGVYPDIITGTSAGAIVGAGYSTGMSISKMEEISQKFSTMEIVDAKMFAIFSNTLLRGKKASRFFEKLFGQTLIEDLDIKYGCIATDLIKAEKVNLTSGKLWEAVRSSMSVPVLFEPYEYNNKLLVDGGLVDNLPTDLAYEFGADIVIAVNVLDYDDLIKVPKNVIRNLINSLYISQKEIVRIKTKADLIININTSGKFMSIFNKKQTSELIELGYNAAKKKSAKIKKILNIK